MSIWDWFKNDADRFGEPVPQRARPVAPQDAALVGDGSEGAQRINERLPRGADVIRDQIDRKERARWARADEIAHQGYQRGHVLLGKYAGRLIGDGGDDRPMITVASARSGKTATVLKPALYTYEGSALILDPKGELAAATAEHRREVLGQDVFVFDPFGVSGQAASPFNPLAELDIAGPTLIDDVDIIAQALIVDEGGSDGNHWTNSARGLVRTLILHALTKPAEERNLAVVRQLLMLTYPALVDAQAAFKSSGTKDVAEATQNALFMEMASQVTAFGGALSGGANSMLRKAPRERSAVASTAEAQTLFLDSANMQASLVSSSVRLSQLAERPTTIYLVLPSAQMEKHFRWLRLIVRLALLALERRGLWPRGKPRILFCMEEFALLQHLQVMESAAAFFPGYGVKLWVILQDASQLERWYRKSFNTFIGNAGIIQAFAVSDKFTLDLLSDRLGSLSFVRGQFGATRSDDGSKEDFVDKEHLGYGHEIAAAFARQTGAQLLMVEGQNPMAIERLTFEDVERIRRATRPVP